MSDPVILPISGSKTTPLTAPATASFSEVSGGKVQVNDLLFYLPPEQIQISSHAQNLEYPLLRSKESVTLKSGHGDLYLSLPIKFVGLGTIPAWKIINEQLSPLVQQFRKTPFCLVENELVRKNVMPGTFDSTTGCRKSNAPNMAFSMVNMTVSTVDGLPGCLQADLSLIYFNYRPFSDRFSYRGNWQVGDNIKATTDQEAVANSSTWRTLSTEEVNPRNSEAWKAFWKQGWSSDRQLTGDLTNQFSLEFKFFGTEKDTGEIKVKRVIWNANKMVPAKIAVSFFNRIAKVPVLNWTYATHQYLGGMNRRIQVVFVLEDSNSQELETLQYLIQKDQEQTSRYRYLNKTVGIKITNDVTKVCGVNQVLIEDLNVDTVPGNPNLKRISLNLLEQFVPTEGMTYASTNVADGASLKFLNRILEMGKQQGVVKQNEDGSWIQDPNYTSKPIADGHNPDPGGPTTAQKQIYDTFFSKVGKYQMSLMDMLNSRARSTDTPAEAKAKDDLFWNQLNETSSALLAGPLANNSSFDDLRTQKFLEYGNDTRQICYKDLDLPKHPATGRVIDTDPDCYFYNSSDIKPIQSDKTFQAGLKMITESYKSFQNTAKRNRSNISTLDAGNNIIETMFDTGVPDNSKSTTPGTINPIPNTATTTQRQAQGMEYFTSQGWSRVQAAALIGNLTYESGGQLDPTAVQQGGGLGRGIAQWSVNERWVELLDYAKTNNIDPMDLATQYAFVNYELTHGEKAAGDALRNATDLATANSIVISKYERPSDSSIQNSTSDRLYQSTLAYNQNPSAVPAVTLTSLSGITNTQGSNCGDALANYLNANYGFNLSRGGLGGEEIASLGESKGATVYNKSNLSLDVMTPGMIIFMKRSPGDQYYGLGDNTHIGIVDKDENGNTVFRSYTTGQGWRAQPVNQDFINNYLPSYIVATNPIAPGTVANPGSFANTNLNGGATSISSVSYDGGRGFDFMDHPPDKSTGNKNQTDPIKLGDNLTPLAGKHPISTSSGTGPLNESYFNPKVLAAKTIQAGNNPLSQTFDDKGAQQLFGQFANSYKDDTLTMRRAYPTFALEFVDEFFRGFFTIVNDAYGWGAVKELRLIRSRKNPVDTLIIELSNARGDLMTEQFNNLTDASKFDNFKFQKNVIKEGTSVSLKLGYNNDPKQLETCFNGVITEIQGQHSAIITIVCQSYAIEMFQDEKGDDPTEKIGWFNSDTKEVLSILLLSPELKHFGRWQPPSGGQVVQAGESGMQHGSMWRYFFNLFPMPADNNIFVPNQDMWDNFKSAVYRIYKTTTWFDSKRSVTPWYQYVPFRQTIWEIIEEYTLRHPGYIASVIPYDGYGAHRASLFFGVPCQNYFYRGPNDSESAQIKSNTGLIGPALILDPSSFQVYQPWNQKILQSRMRPFRNYFYIDSEHHIVDNGLIATARDTFNGVAVEYVEDSTTAFENDSKLPDPSAFFTNDTVKVKADDDIPEDHTRWFHTRERNCEGDWMAMRYGMGYLFKHLKDIYTGEIIILGEPKMKPYDTVFIFDSYNDIAGPIEVEQVTHIFSPENGFLSIITPDLVVNTNEYASAGVLDAIGMWMKGTWLNLWGKSVTQPFGTGQPNSQDASDIVWGKPSYSWSGPSGPVDSALLTTAGAMEPLTSILGARAMAQLGLAAGATAGLPLMLSTAIFGTAGFFFVMWAKQRQPIRVTPLLWKGRPLLCGLDGFNLDNGWSHILGKTGDAISGFKMFWDKTKESIRDVF